MPHERKLSIRRVPPSEVGWARNLYSFPEGEEADRQLLETSTFSNIDNAAAQVLVKLNAQRMQHLTDAETTAWTIFMMSLFHRTPENLAAAKEAGARVRANIAPQLKERYAEYRKEGDPETFEEYEQTLSSTDTEQMLLRVLPGIIGNPRIGQFINNLTWLVFDLPGEVRDLMLSDDPVLTTGGLKKPGAHWAMPLSPRRFMVAALEPATLHRVQSAPVHQMVDALNEWMVEGAREFVVATNRSRTAYIQERFGADLRPGLGRQVSV